MNCNNCGAPLNSKQSFCTQCGQIVSKSEEQSNSIPVIYDKPVYKQSSVAVKRPMPKKKKSVIILSAIMTVVAIVVGVVLFATADSREMKRALNTQNAETVMLIYNRLLRKGKLSTADKVLADYIYSAADTLNEDFTYTLDSEKGIGEVRNYMHNTFMPSKWGTVFWNDGKSELYDIDSLEIESALEEFDAIADSKIAYYTGEYLMQNAEDYEDYNSAMRNYANVLEDDKNYSDSVEKYSQASNAYFEAIVSLADSYISENDYSAAISLLSGELDISDDSLSDELQAKLEEIKKTYAANYATKAEEAFKQHDIDSAIGNIKVAMELLPENGDYKAKYDTYQLYLPFELYIKDNCLKVSETGVFWGTLAFDVSEESNNNIDMPHSLTWFNHGDDSSTSINANYKLDGKYDVITGTFFLTKSEKNTLFKGWFKVYGDGKLLYESEKMTSGILPKNFSVQVTNVQNLTISFLGEGTGGFTGSTDFGISDLVAQKNFPE